MGLDDLLPENAESKSSPGRTNRSSSSTGNNDQEQQQFHKVVGNPPNQKKFTEEQWEKVKRVVDREMGLNIQEVVNNTPAEKRYDILHEAILFDEGEVEAEEMDNYSDERCVICGNATGAHGAVISGESVHVHHTVGQLAKELDDNS